jgi:hypothetical protein
MKKIQSMVAIGFGCATVALAAQTSPATQGGANQTPNTASAGSEMTIVGCLQRGDQASGAAASGNATQSGTAGSFVLANASPQTSAGAAAGKTTGGPDAAPGSTAGSTAAGRATTEATAGTSGAGTSGMSYMLDGGTNLAANVGKRVEVKGTLVAGTAASAPSGGGASGASSGVASGSATGAGGSSAMATQRLRVASVREIGGDCTPAASRSGAGTNR